VCKTVYYSTGSWFQSRLGDRLQSVIFHDFSHSLYENIKTVLQIRSISIFFESLIYLFKNRFKIRRWTDTASDSVTEETMHEINLLDHTAWIRHVFRYVKNLKEHKQQKL
jgi:hypothetical protein